MTADKEKQLRESLEKLIISRELVKDLEKKIKEEEAEQKKAANVIIKAARVNSTEFTPPTVLKLFKATRTFILRFEDKEFWDPITRAKNVLVEEIKNGFKK